MLTVPNKLKRNRRSHIGYGGFIEILQTNKPLLQKGGFNYGEKKRNKDVGIFGVNFTNFTGSNGFC
jgi:acyl CoA:acetate/3-ketoacid CoA transferase